MFVNFTDAMKQALDWSLWAYEEKFSNTWYENIFMLPFIKNITVMTISQVKRRENEKEDTIDR